MALPFFNKAARASRLAKASKGHDQLLAIDLGGRMTKAVHMQRKGNGFAISGYALVNAPVYEKTLSVDVLCEHLKNVSQTLELKTKQVVALAIGVNDSLVRSAEMPLMPIEDMRQVLKINAKSYLQQDLPGHVFDCDVVPPKQSAKGDKAKGAGSVKSKVLVAGAKKQFIDDIQTAIKDAGLLADHIVPSLIGPVNAFELALPDLFGKEVIALVDIGFKNTTICLLQEGELVLSRVVNIGGDRLTSGLAESMGISYAEAEGIKVGMPSEVQSQLENLISPLGKELRASVDFFEHQQDRSISQVFVSGGSARSEFIVDILHNEMAIECKTWNPVTPLHLMLSPHQTAEIEHIAPQLSVAIGAALAAF